MGLLSIKPGNYTINSVTPRNRDFTRNLNSLTLLSVDLVLKNHVFGFVIQAYFDICMHVWNKKKHANPALTQYVFK